MTRISPARPRPSRSRTTRAVVVAIVGLCFVLRQVLVPFHLASHDHVSPGEAVAHGHAHGGHVHDAGGHRHESPRTARPSSEREHRPHPAADHLNELQEPALPAAPTGVAFALAPASPPLLPGAAPEVGLAEEVDSSPRPPPPRRAPDPRAPPFVS